MCSVHHFILRKAVGGAKAALPEWASNPQRWARILFRFKDLLEQNSGELAELLNSEHDKVVWDSIGDVQQSIDVVEFACGISRVLKGSRAGCSRMPSPAGTPSC